MVKKNYVERGNKMCLKVSEKNKEGKVVSRIVPASNFVFSPVTQVSNTNDRNSIFCAIIYLILN
jgi:hypothetical protein